MKKLIASIVLAVLALTTQAGPASALNTTRSGGGHCTRVEVYTNARGYVDYRCLSYLYR